MTNGVLYPYSAEMTGKLLSAWLSPIRRSGTARRIDNPPDPLPFTLITKIGGTECPQQHTAEPLMSLHTLCDKNLGYEAAEAEADTTHRAMLELARSCDPILMPDGSTAVVDYTEVVQSQTPVIYDDVSILQWIGRYKLGLSYIYVGSVSSS